MIKVQFVREHGFLSNLIAWFSAGTFSHVDTVLPNGALLGARNDCIGGKPPGVQIRPPYYMNAATKVRMWLNTTPEQEAVYYDFLNAQLGKPYDKIAIIGFAVDRDWRDPSDWFCSELVAAALEYCKVCPRLYTPANKITPVGLASIMSALGAHAHVVNIHN